MDDRHVCITGSEIGEITFFEMSSGEELATFIVTGCVDHLLLAHQPDHSTHLLVSSSSPTPHVRLGHYCTFPLRCLAFAWEEGCRPNIHFPIA